MAVAIEGEAADPRVPAPGALRPVLGFSRLSSAAYGVIQRVVDDDGMFRARVAEQADEAALGRAGWLWLHRPVDWMADPAVAGSPSEAAAAAAPSAEPAEAAPGRRDEKAAVARLRKAAADADAARRRTADQLAEARKIGVELRAERDRLAESVRTLQDERNAAVRTSKDVEARLAEARRDLKVAREATRQAEAELRQVRSSGAPAPGSAAPPAVAVAVPTIPLPAAPPPQQAQQPPVDDGIDRAAVGASIRAAAKAAEDLAASLAGAAAALTAAPAPGAAADPEPGRKAKRSHDGAPDKRHKAKGHKAKGGARRHPALPPGVFDGTVEAHRHLIATASNLLVVDGYNVARAAWSGLAPEEERRRTVALLDDVQARSGAKVIVVFDGDDAVTAPKASKTVRVRFSATGQTADDAITDLLVATPVDQAVVVVSSDRAVAADARRLGAVAVGSRAFLVAAGR
ncbi:NYN domain-containing protein [Aquihabitans sp. McL0605]|uniref:NYN domain-containing protein n=1 Tax=Aquihabitans sp. McL0605 TaxID=3415671 RepID=UPI003CF6B466